MKKKKSPALMIGAVVILVSIAVITNLINSGFFDKLREQRIAQSQPPAPETSKETSEEMRSRLNAMRASPAAKSASSGTPAKPTVETEKPQKYKPKPSETATSGQWY